MKPQCMKIRFTNGNETMVDLNDQGGNDQIRIAQKPLTELQPGDIIEFDPSYDPGAYFKATVESIELLDKRPPIGEWLDEQTRKT